MDTRGFIFCKDASPLFEMINSNNKFILSKLNGLYSGLACVAVAGMATSIFTHLTVKKLKKRIYDLENAINDIEVEVGITKTQNEKENC